MSDFAENARARCTIELSHSQATILIDALSNTLVTAVMSGCSLPRSDVEAMVDVVQQIAANGSTAGMLCPAEAMEVINNLRNTIDSHTT